MSKLVDKLTTEEMIAEVKKYNLLWDPTLEAYQNSQLRKQAWRSIMAELIPQLDTYSSTEQAKIESDIRRRWKSIRTCYSRELLKQKTDDPSVSWRKQYQYFDQLRFLDVPKNDAVNEEEIDNRLSSPKPVNDSVPVQKPSIHLKRKSEKFVDEKPSKKKRSVQYRNLELENEADKMFLLSLVPDLQRVPPGIKLQLKSDILNSILRAQQQDPLSGNQFYVTQGNLNMPSNLNSAGEQIYNNIPFHKNLKELQQDGLDEDAYVSPNNFGMDIIKMEAADSLTSLEDRGSLVGSEDCDDIYLA